MAGGGAERQLVYLTGELMRRGWDVHVVLLKEGPNYGGLVSTGSTIHKIPASGNHDITILWRLLKLIRNIRPHLVQTWMTQMDVFGGIASRLTDTSFILSERSSASAYPRSFKNSLRVFVGRYAAAIVSNSPGGNQYWRMQIGDSVPKYVVQNGLPLEDIAKVDYSADPIYLPPGSKVLLFVSRFSAEKNIDNVIRAFKIVASQRDAILLLCGEGELQPRIEEMIRDENLKERVILLGYVSNLWKVMRRADLFIAVSTFEGHPNAVLEAMANGCPLILSDIPAHRAFLDEEEAFFVDPGSASDIAQAILTCMENPEKAKQMAQKAKAVASSFSIPTITDQYEKIYNHILANPNPERY